MKGEGEDGWTEDEDEEEIDDETERDEKEICESVSEVSVEYAFTIPSSSSSCSLFCSSSFFFLFSSFSLFFRFSKRRL